LDVRYVLLLASLLCDKFAAYFAGKAPVRYIRGARIGFSLHQYKNVLTAGHVMMTKVTEVSDYTNNVTGYDIIKHNV
jgi:hypothetical protein